MKIRFAGAAQTVTGSRNLLSFRNKTILIDAGLFQGPKDSRLLNWNPDFTPKKIDAIILSHAHIDHSGLIPKLYKEGFRGPIYCSKSTFDLCSIMLVDSAHLQEEDAKYANVSGYSHHSPALPLYTIEDAKESLELFYTIPQNEWKDLFDGLSIRLTRSGHILGSSFVEISFVENDVTQKITYSGDLGNGRSQIIKPPTHIEETDYLVLESTYGDRLQPRVDPKIPLAEVINKVFNRQGILVIPSFTVGRTQDILHLIQTLKSEQAIPNVSVYVDSPMANAANKIFLKHFEEHQIVMDKNDHLIAPITLTDFTAITNMEDSKKLVSKTTPSIIITASGMLTGGRVMHHLKERLPNPKNAVLFVGYQALNTKGRLLQEGLKKIRIHHQEIPVEAEIITMEGLSAHADYQDTLEWLTHLKKVPKMIFINHGEKVAAESLKKRIEEKFNFPCTIPRYMEEFKLNM